MFEGEVEDGWVERVTDEEDEWLTVVVFQDQSDVLQKMDTLQTGTSAGEDGLSCGEEEVESGGTTRRSQESGQLSPW